MRAPRKLSVHPMSPSYDKAACAAVDKVFVDGVYLPSVRAYDMDAGWAAQQLDGLWKPKIYGTVTVKMKP